MNSATGRTPVLSLRRRSLRALFVRFRRDRTAATAVEFAMVALPFIFMTFAIIELALVFMVDVSLDNATAVEARCFRVGTCTADGAGDTASVNSIKQDICSNMSWLSAQCQSNLYVDIRQFTSFTGAGSPSPINNGTFNSNQLCDASGPPGSVDVMTTYYRWPLLTPFLYGGLSNLKNGVAMLSATEVMQFEPFPGSTTSNATC